MKRTPIILIVAVLGILGIGAAIMALSGDDTEEEENTTTPTEEAAPAGLLSENGNYLAAFTSAVEPVPVNEMHTWTLRLTTPDGEPVENATITVDGSMPDHGHGLPTEPEVTEYLGAGEYRVEGMRFNMPGFWLVNFHLPDDTVTFELTLR